MCKGMFLYCLWVFVTLSTFNSFYLASSEVRIKELKVPQYIKNEGEKSVILDCDYDYTKDEDFEIKWYYKNDSNLIYQWIPQKSEPQAVGQFRDLIDTSYKVSNDAHKEHRAILFKQVSPELSGNYTCKISGLFHEDVETKKMIIYEPADQFSILFLEQTKSVVCEAKGLSHEPKVTLSAFYLSGDNETLPRFVEDQYIVENTPGTFDYNITAIYRLSEEALSESAKFECILTLPDTDYEVRRSFVVYSGASPQLFFGLWTLIFTGILTRNI